MPSMAAVPASAGKNKPQPTQHQSALQALELSQKAFAEGKFQQALRLLLKIEQQPNLSDEIRARVLLEMGITHSVLNHHEQAAPAMKSALQLDPLIDLSSQEVKSSALNLFLSTRERLRGMIELTADKQEQAEAKIDGEKCGFLPYKGTLRIGRHEVEVISEDKLWQAKQSLVIFADRLSSVHVILKPVQAALSINTTPPGAEVMIDRTRQGYSPLGPILISPGKHRLQLQLFGHLPYKQDVFVAGGKKDYLQIALKAMSGTHLLAVPNAKYHQQGRPKRLWTWIFASTAVFSGAIGLGFGIWAKNGYAQYQEAAAQGNEARYLELREAVPARAWVANSSLIFAGACAITSGILYFLQK